MILGLESLEQAQAQQLCILTADILSKDSDFNWLA